MSKLNYIQKLLIIVSLTFILVLMADIVFVNLLLNKIDSLNNKVLQLETSSVERLKELRLDDSLVSTASSRARLETYFVPAGNLATVEFTKYLETLAATLGVEQNKTLAVGEVVGLPKSEILSSIQYRFSVAGHFGQIFNFIKAIENLTKISSLTDVSIRLETDQPSAKNQERNWSADLDFSVLKFK